MPAFAFYVLAAACEIGGCYAVWAVLRLRASPAWFAAGFLSLAVFAWALAQVESPAAGRVFAAYGGIYILASLAWMAAVEGIRPDRWDVIGALVCVAGAGIIMLAPRG